MSMEEYFEALREAAEELRSIDFEVPIIFHDDADGLCSAAIASMALDRVGIRYKLYCVEKLHPAIVKLLHSKGYKLYIYLDIGSGRADLIVKSVEEQDSRAIIVDHHDPRRVESKRVIHLNPELYGFSGETDVSGSTATYLFMRELSRLDDAAWMAVVGSAEIPGDLRSLNRIPLEDAVKVGDVEVKRAKNRERYLIKFLKKPWNKLSSILTAMGSVGYYRDGPYLAVEFLKKRMIEEDRVKEFEELRKKKFNQAFAILAKKGLRVDGMVQWFHLGDLFKGLGSKTVGTFTSMLSYRKTCSPDKYLIGFMKFEKNLPRIGEIDGEWVKASIRTPKHVADEIRAGKLPPASNLTVKSAEKVGGSGDGHSFAASALIPAGREEEFIEEFNRLIDDFTRS
ncbi:MAG: DHH family phosphoesterase [Thaumarchaeota archaeon]|nr:DHH family phosphoesterase [Nitrososphaerota archaeon]